MINMLKNKDILDESNKILKKTSNEVVFPMDKKDLKNIDLMIEYLTNSQIEEKAQKYNLRPGMGMAGVQLGVLKRYFVVVLEIEEEVFETYVIVNPKILSTSSELIYVEDGEGCLSVNRETEGIVLRHARITIECFNTNGDKLKIRAREDLAIAFQHEIDHLNGIMFTDKIDKTNPFKDKDLYRSI